MSVMELGILAAFAGKAPLAVLSGVLLPVELDPEFVFRMGFAAGCAPGITFVFRLTLVVLLLVIMLLLLALFMLSLLDKCE